MLPLPWQTTDTIEKTITTTGDRTTVSSAVGTGAGGGDGSAGAGALGGDGIKLSGGSLLNRGEHL